MAASSLTSFANFTPYPCLFLPPPSKPSFISFSLAKPTSSSSLTSHQLPSDFTPKQLIETLRKQNDAEMALWVFDWASKQPSFKPTLSVFEEILKKLGNEGSFDSMIRVLGEMKLSGCEINQGTFLIFIESYVGCGLYDEAVSVIDLMENEFGMSCGTHTFKILWHSIRSELQTN